MKFKKRLFSAILIISFFVMIISCATTTLKNVWRDRNYQGKFKRVFVIGIIKTPTVKRFFEDEFVLQLKAEGTDAIASYMVLPSDREINIKDLAAKIAGSGADGVLITRLVDRKTVETYVPGGAHYGSPIIDPHAPPQSYGSPPPYAPPRYAPLRYTPPRYYDAWHDYYRNSNAVIYVPGYTVKDEVIVIETNLYEASTEKLVWSAISETFYEGGSNALISSFIKIMVKNLSKENLL